jgi:hypothetical protein
MRKRERERKKKRRRNKTHMLNFPLKKAPSGGLLSPLDDVTDQKKGETDGWQSSKNSKKKKKKKKKEKEKREKRKEKKRKIQKTNTSRGTAEVHLLY